MNITFVIPAYNAGKTLAESVNSIFNENFVEGDEIIIVNDCSVDNTKNVIEDLSKRYGNKIKVINNIANIGCPASRNVGIKQSKNELIFNLDSDNILPPGSVRFLKDALIKDTADIASFEQYHYFKLDTKKITHKWLCKTGSFNLQDLFSGMVNPAPGGNFLYRKSNWEKIGGYWEYGKGLHEAWGYSFKSLTNNAKFIVVPNTFYFHRYSHESLFVRENKRSNESIRITNMFIQDYLHLFSDKSLRYIKKNPNWFNDLEKHPLTLDKQGLGVNGRILFTSKVKQILYRFKKNIIK